MHQPASSTSTLAEDVLNQIEGLLQDARQSNKPLEIDPHRGRLFELFVTADAAGYLDEEAENDLTAEGICRRLARRWGLDEAARESFQQQAKLPPEELAKMRALWSLMRMWMEWTYAWQRWDEFHGQGPDRNGSGDASQGHS